MTPFEFTVVALACWRVAWFIVYDNGPFDIMKRLRQKTTLGGLLDCIYCASVWSAMLVLLLWLCAPVVVYVCAISGAALAINRWIAS